MGFKIRIESSLFQMIFELIICAVVVVVTIVVGLIFQYPRQPDNFQHEQEFVTGGRKLNIIFL